jgi:alpha-tubulin suppressor-like RCC1 family protein
LQIAIGDETVCLRVDASLRCWLRSVGAQVPIMTATPPIAGLGDVSDFAVGGHHVCALTSDGKVFCWGDNSNGQLGAGRTEERVDAPVRVPGIEGAVGLAAGLFHTCVVLGDGRVTCWGWNADGQTGSDVEYAREARELVVPAVVAGVSGVTNIAAGRDQTCAKTKAGWSCWGRSHLKSQTDARGDHHNQPAKVDDLDGMEQLTLKDETACGLFQDGHVGCWGAGAFSILANRPLRANNIIIIIILIRRMNNESKNKILLHK